MNVVNRTQNTEVVVRREVTHNLEHEGIAYIRYSTVVTTVPRRDQEVKVLSERIRWQKHINEDQVQEIPKKEVKELERWFSYITPRDLNNIRNYFEEVNK